MTAYMLILNILYFLGSFADISLSGWTCSKKAHVVFLLTLAKIGLIGLLIMHGCDERAW